MVKIPATSPDLIESRIMIERMIELNFQLVFQFDPGEEDHSVFVELMLDIERHFARERNIKIDGYDSGRDEVNIFIHTNDPLDVFEKTAEYIRFHRPGLTFSAGYRTFGDDNYTSLYPRSSTTFTVS